MRAALALAGVVGGWAAAKVGRVVLREFRAAVWDVIDELNRSGVLDPDWEMD